MTNKNYAISAIRFISCISIVLCHILQYYDIELAFWFNVAVQIFLMISGYLYSKYEYAMNIGGRYSVVH